MMLYKLIPLVKTGNADADDDDDELHGSINEMDFIYSSMGTPWVFLQSTVGPFVGRFPAFVKQ